MVATVEKRKQQGGRQVPVSILLRMKARNLYLALGLSYDEIASQTGLPISTVGYLVHKEGWAKLRRERNIAYVKKSDTRIDSLESEAMDTIASECTEIALSGVAKTRRAVERNDENSARDFQACANGVKTMVNVVQAIRAPKTELQADAGRTLNLFFCATPAAKPSEPTNVTPNSVIPLVT